MFFGNNKAKDEEIAALKLKIKDLEEGKNQENL